MLFGSAGSGKTCTMQVILDEDPPEEYTSTPLAARPVKVYRVDMTESEWKKLSRKEQDLVIAKACHSYDAYELADLAQISDVPPAFISTSNSEKVRAKHSSIQPTFSHIATASKDGDGAKTSKGEVAPVLPSLDTYDGLLSRMEECSTNDAITVIKRVQISDCGGQPQFHEVLPVFIKGTTLYLFVFKLNEELSAHPVVKYYENGKAICDAYPRAETNEQILEHCLRVIRSQKATVGSEPPRIMIIGTHKDKEHECTKETRAAKNEKLINLLLPEFVDEVEFYCRDPKQLVFPLNAKTPGDEEKGTAKYVRTLVSECSASIVEIPLQWHGLEVLLEDLVKVLKRGILSIEECLTAAQDLHFDDEAAFDAALKYLHELNIVFYYPDILPGVVFASAQVLLDKVTELVKAIHEERYGTAVKRNRRGKMWRRFCDHALVSAEFLAQEEFQKHYKPGLFDHNDLMLLFKKLLIFAVISEMEVFVPALLRRLTKDELREHRISCNASPLVLTFPKYGGPLLGVFCATVVALLSPDNVHPCRWKLDMKDDGITPACLYRNCVQFNIPDRPGSITLVDSFEQIEVHVSPAALKAGKEDYPKSIKRAIIESIRKSTLALHYNYDKPELCLGCPCGTRPDFHLAKLGENSVWICSKNKEEFGTLTPQQKLLLEEDLEDHKMPSLSDSTPELHQLDLFERHCMKLELIACVTADWERVATRLHFPGYTIKAVSRDSQHQSDQACRSMFTRWLNGEGRQPVTWGTLITALYEAKLASVAQELDNMVNGTSKSKYPSKEPHRMSQNCQLL